MQVKELLRPINDGPERPVESELPVESEIGVLLLLHETENNKVTYNHFSKHPMEPGVGTSRWDKRNPALEGLHK